MRVYELDCFTDFYSSLILSFVVGLMFDFIRSLGIKSRKISDTIFSVCAFIIISYVWIFYLGGIVRWYVILTIISGTVIYFFAMSKYIYPLLYFITKKIRQFCHFIFKILLTLLHFLGKISICMSKIFRLGKVKRKINMIKTKFKMNILVCLVVITVIASVTMVIKGVILQPIVSANYEKAEQLDYEIACENQRIEEINLMTEKVGTDEYIEKIAREKLGMIRSDEIVFIDISGQ